MSSVKQVDRFEAVYEKNNKRYFIAVEALKDKQGKRGTAFYLSTMKDENGNKITDKNFLSEFMSEASKQFESEGYFTDFDSDGTWA